jgi:hypothetical protein
MTLEKDINPRSRLPRLRSWWAKLLYVIASLAIYYVVGGLAPTNLSRGILRSVIVVILVMAAVRVFRGAAEEGDEPRPWWRMTGGPLAGFILGGVLALTTIGLCLNAYGVESKTIERIFAGQDIYDAVTAVLVAALAVFYITSSVRLRAIAREERQKEIKGGRK